MSFFKVPSFLGSRSREDPNHQTDAGLVPQYVGSGSSEVEDEEFYDANNSAADEGSFLDYHEGGVGPNQQYYPSDNYQANNEYGHAYPPQEYGQIEYGPPPGGYYEGQPQGNFPDSPLTNADTQQEFFPPAPQFTAEEMQMINQLMAEGYSFVEAQRVMRYRTRQKHTVSSLTFNESFLQYNNQPPMMMPPMMPPMMPVTSRTMTDMYYPPPSASFYAYETPYELDPYLLPPVPQNSFIDYSVPQREAPLRDPPIEVIEMAVQRSIIDEEMRLRSIPPPEREEREAIERANEKAVQVALQKSYDELKDELAMRGSDPYMIERLNEQALRDALNKSMYEVRSPPPPPPRPHMVTMVHDEAEISPPRQGATTKMLRRVSTESMSEASTLTRSVVESEKAPSRSPLPTFNAPRPIPPSDASVALPGSYAVSYNSTKGQELQTKRDDVHVAQATAMVSSANVAPPAQQTQPLANGGRVVQYRSSRSFRKIQPINNTDDPV